MVELADVFRRYGSAYRQKYGARLLPSHRQAMQAIEACRTAALGGQVFYCPQCDEAQYSYHSCRNRHCPKCQQQAAQGWLARQEHLRLPVPYFLLTFTLPAGLRDLSYHPHVHYLVPGGGLMEDHWQPARPDFLVHVRPLARLFRANFRAALRQTELYDQVPTAVWQQDWVVHCLPVGDGRAALKYLAPYIFRVALCNRRILRADDGLVTFQYTDRESGESRHCTLAAEPFIQRFLQHVLPKGFVKVRYYGFFSAGNRPRLRLIRQLLGALAALPPQQTDPTEEARRCPVCGGVMRLLERLSPVRKRPP